ncbi:hypothetical protein J4Q44_G00081610 [Coregonus suidteri]|uniref:Tankyrase 1-binding protein C-terminal domain-containing protein n=1 Tax=Coregonus suidteri TaxID=861788 RepID=A0AAN8QYC5_9TELE
MAARVDVDSGEVGQAGDAGVKPEPGPKPCLIPKPFSLQRNTTFRSILAPKTLTTTPQPSQTMPTTSSKPEPCQPISAPVSDSSSAVKLDRESTTIPELTNALEAPSAITPQTDSTHTTEQNQTALSTSLTTPTSEPPASTTSDPTGTSEANQVSLSELDEHGDSDTGHSTTGTEAVPSPSVTSTPLQPQSENTVSEPTPAVVRRHSGKDQAARWGGGRKRLSMELTSRFESAGLSLSSQPPAKQEWEQVTKRETAVPKVSVLRAKEEEKVTDSPGSSSDPEHSAPLKEERDGEGVKEEGVKKGSSIQRRISLLLDSSLKPEALTKREEVPCPMKQADSSVGVKQRIKDWAADTPPVQASNQRVDVAPQPFPVRVHPVLCVTGGSLATSKSVQLAPREDKASTLLRSGHSGIEDEEDEDEDEEEEEGEEEEVPLYKTVGRLLGQEDGGTQQELVVDQIGNEMEAKPEPPSPSTTVPIIEPIPKEEKQPHIEVVYDDFSVKEEKPLIKMVYDDFSVKPRRWGSQARLLADRAQVESPSPGTEEPGSLGPSENDLQRTVVDTQEPSQESPVSVEPHPAERDLEGGVPTPKDGTENEQEKEKKEEEKYKEEGTSVDTEEDQLRCCVGAGEGRDTEALIGGEPDKQYGGCDTRLSEDDCPQMTEDQISPVITPDEPDSTSPLEETEDQVLPVITPDEPDSTSPLEETEDPLPFPDISAPLLDTSVLRARAELRKSRRTRPPRTVRQSSTTVMLEEDPVHDWRFYDSSDKVDSLTRGDCESDEEQPRGREVCSPPSQPQRIALFSGMDPSALKAQLKKRRGGGGGGAGGGEGVDTDRQTDRLAPSPSQLSRSPRRSSFLPGASRVLPPVGNKGGGGDTSPSWLRELKSKKRSSQYNSEA